MRDAARTDTNQAEIVSALRYVGAKVHCLHQVGDGVPDLLVCYADTLYLMEVKSDTGKLLPSQIAFALEFPVIVVRSIGDALRAIGLMA